MNRIEVFNETLLDGKENPIAKLMINIMATLSEFERERILERQAEGKKQKSAVFIKQMGEIEHHLLYKHSSTKKRTQYV